MKTTQVSVSKCLDYLKETIVGQHMGPLEHMGSVFEGWFVVSQPCFLREQGKGNECVISDTANETCLTSYKLQPGKISFYRFSHGPE